VHLGVDIGGTKILALLLGPKGKVLARSKRKLKGTDPQSVLRRAAQCAADVIEEAEVDLSQVAGVGLAVPSSVHDGRAVLAPALGWRDVPVIKLARQHFPRPIYLGNDVNLGVAAEHCHGAARGVATVTGFFLGTGVGGAVIHDGKLLRGQDDLAGELGHIIVVPGGRRCGCGNFGCLEAYASKTAFLARLKEEIFRQRRKTVLRRDIQPDTPMISSQQLYGAYAAGDALVREIVDDGVRLVGLAASSVINILSPGRVVLGGGVVEAFGAPLVRAIRSAAKPHIFGSHARAKTIVASELGDDAVPLGAALLAQGEGQLLS
jgi:glucokinase